MMTPFLSFLTEDRLPAIIAKFEPQFKKLMGTPDTSARIRDEDWKRISDKLFQNISQIDPTPNKAYTQWLFQIMLNTVLAGRVGESYVNGWIRVSRFVGEDADAIKQDLEIFNRVKARMPANQRDINVYKTHLELRNAITPYMQTVSKSEEERDYVKKLYDSKQITLVYKGPEGKVEIPHTEEASKYLGRGTRWCTAAEKNNYFKSYNSRGHLFVYTFVNGTKWQFHIETNSFMNAQDSHIGPEVTAAVKLVTSSAKYVLALTKMHENTVLEIMKRFGVTEASPEMLEVISFSPELSLRYALQTQKPFLKGERAISANPEYSMRYAIEILKKRFHTGESMILLNQSALQYAIYAKYVIKGRWPEAEKRLLASRDTTDLAIYAVVVMNRNWPEAEFIVNKLGAVEAYKYDLKHYSQILNNSDNFLNQFGRVA